MEKMLYLVRQNYRNNVCVFRNIKKQLTDALCKTVVIEHIGSTAIPKMSGKNIIDVALGVQKNVEIEAMAAQLENMGYHRGITHSKGDYIFLASRLEETRCGDVHIHVLLENSKRFIDFLAFRAYLLKYPHIAQEYCHLKRKLSKKMLSREEHKQEKSRYVERLMQSACTECQNIQL